jgi:hypothetical protein
LTLRRFAPVYAAAASSGRRAPSGAITMDTGRTTLGETLSTAWRGYYFAGYYFARFYR